MNRLEFIFAALNAIASKKQSPMIECLLAQAVLREIHIVKRELRMKAAAAGSSSSMQLVMPQQSDTLRQAS
jgi:hypothetical protein